MNTRHKYFRNQRHKKKLEARAGTQKTYWAHVMYFTDEPDPGDLRRNQNVILHRSRYYESVEDSLNWYIDFDRKMGNGKFIYYEQPEIPYTVHKVYTKKSYSKRRQDLLKYANRLVRRRWKQCKEDDSYQHRQYKKVFDVAWELD